MLLGCQSEEEIAKEAQAQEYKQQQLIALKEKQKQEAQRILEEKREQERLEKERNASTVYQMGLSMNDGKIIFDTNRAKSFFGSMVSKVEENNSTIVKSMGIDVNEKENNLTIDFNKTRAFFKHWSSKIELFAKDISSFGEKIDNNNSSKN
jgi:hypothetical protein